MSDIYQKHVRELRTAVQDYFTTYQTARAARDKSRDAYQTAAEDARVFSARNPGAGLEIARHNLFAENARIEATENEQNFQTIRKGRYDIIDKAAQIKAQMKAELEAAAVVNPADVDANTMRLIDSGILTGADYAKLYSDAETAGNVTMMRLIGKYAGDAAEIAEGDDRATLNNIYHSAKSVSGRDDLTAYDHTVSALTYGIGTVESGREENPTTIQFWIDSTGGED